MVLQVDCQMPFIITYMKQKNWKTVEALLSLCHTNQLDTESTIKSLASGELEFDEDKKCLIAIEKKLTKPEQKERVMIDAAREGIAFIMADEKLKTASLSAIKKIIFRKYPEIYIESPQVFGRHIANAVNNYDKDAGNDFTRPEPVAQIKESEINPAMKDWAEKNGLEVTPLPDQKPI